MTPGALAGVRVLDFTSLLAGPFATLFLGFLGAETIKVESRMQVDGARRPPYSFDDPENSPVFNTLNLNKQSVQLNLKEPEAVELALKIASVSDAVVENMRPGVMDRLGLGYDRLREANPTLVMVSISNGGATGPESAFPGYANVFNSMSGLGHLTGYPDAPPTELRDSIDARVASTAALALLMGLFHRLRTGEGQFIDLSSRESIVVYTGEALMDYAMNSRVSESQGNRETGAAPQGCYPCLDDDSWVTISVAGQEEWLALCSASGHGEWLADPRFTDPLSRHRNQDALDGLLAGWTSSRSANEAAETLQKAGVCAAPSMSSRDLVADDHLNHRGTWTSIQHPFMGPQTVQGPPWKFSGTPASIRAPGPTMGQHNSDILMDLLGASKSQVAEWQERRVVY